MYKGDYITRNWETVRAIRKPVIAAVSGFALGGGCELAMLCDFILASESAKFGQPEINLGVMPGIGGTQRLTRYVGKSKAMEMCLTGRMMDAAEAERSGLVSRVLPADKLTATAVPETITQVGGRSVLTASGGTPPYTWTVSDNALGSLADGVDTGQSVVYVASTLGSGDNSVRCEDSSGQSVSVVIMQP
ncbi:MAG: putative enoyl-CoA hydratase echA8 [Verrucomicrobia bacterium ADurb.Bin345]|nr:MAG: putative enoyl-CoA hydratase echA8 [Verrucomicrobia bacterium ADurb.Bin345]